MRTAYRDLVEGKGQKKAKEKPPLPKHSQGLLPWLSEMVEGKPPHEIQDQGRQKEKVLLARRAISAADAKAFTQNVLSAQTRQRLGRVASTLEKQRES